MNDIKDWILVFACILVLILFWASGFIIIKVQRSRREKERMRTAEIKNAVFRGEAELFQKVVVRSLEEMSGMPGEYEIGPDNLPRYFGSVDWGLLQVYHPHGGGCYHRTPNCSTPYGGMPMHIWTAYRQGLFPCNKCKPPKPNFDWYRRYLVLYDLAKKYNTVLLPYPGPSDDYELAKRSGAELESLRNKIRQLESAGSSASSDSARQKLQGEVASRVRALTFKVMSSGLFQNTLVSHDIRSRISLDSNARLLRAISDEPEIISPLQVSAQIRGNSGMYTTSLMECSCEDFRHTHEPCKHMYWLALNLGLLLSVDTRKAKESLSKLAAEKAKLERLRKKKSP